VGGEESLCGRKKYKDKGALEGRGIREKWYSDKRVLGTHLGAVKSSGLVY